MKLFATLLAFSAVLLLCSAGYVSQHGFLQTKGKQVVDKNGKPVMLRGVSLFWSQWMGQFWNYNVLATLKKDWHINVIRAAMGVEEGGYLQNSGKEKQKLIAVVEAAIKLDLYVIIDWHDHHGQSHTDQAVKFFTEMAQKYGKRANVIFETYNEPLEGSSWSSTIKPYHQKVVGAIRKYSNNLVVCGTRTWSQRVDEAAKDPLKFKNVAYTLHFYSGSHRQELRNIAQAALNMNAPIFVTECGVSEASGNGKFDKTEFDKWIGFLESNKISWVVWALNDKAETSALLKPGASPKGNWNSNQLSTAGKYIQGLIRSKQ